MRVKFNYKPNTHQILFHDDVMTKYLHLSTGFGGGKSYALVMKALKLSFLNRPHAGGFVCPSFPEFKKDILPMFEDILEANKIKYQYHQTDHWFKFPWTKGKLYVVTAEKKLRGPNWAYAAINEVTLIPLARYREVVSRVRIRGSTVPQIASVGTPEGIASDYYELFVEKPLEGSRVIYGDTRANSDNLSPDFVNSIMQAYDQVAQQAYLSGQFVNMMGNRFYYSYSVKNEDLSIREDLDDNVHVGLDFNVDPMAATIWQLKDGGLRCFDEIILQDADTNKMAEALKSRGYLPHRTFIYPDPSGSARSTKGFPDHEILRRHGFLNIRARAAHPGLRQRQLNVNNLLEKAVIKINPSKCPILRRDYLSVEQDKVSLEKIKKNPKLTHTSDGMDYLCDILFPFSGNRSAPRVVSFR